MPTFFGEPSQQRLNNGDPLDFSNYGTLCRELGKSIQFYTSAPDVESLQYVVAELIDRYPSIVSGNTEESKQAIQVMCFRVYL